MWNIILFYIIYTWKIAGRRYGMVAEDIIL